MIKGATNKGRIYSYIVKEFFKDGIRFNIDEDIEKLKLILESEFNIVNEEENLRALKATIERTCI